MTTPRLLFLIPLLLFTALAHATGTHEYGRDEYVTVSAGLSPDGKFAVTAHGSSNYDGYHGFHLYFTDAITGKKIGVLKEVVDSLNTNAANFAAKWSSDSQQVTIVYQVGRHVPLKAISYRLVGRHLRRIKGPFDVDYDDALGVYWGSPTFGPAPDPKVFGTPLNRN
jgi:hypothetical protein